MRVTYGVLLFTVQVQITSPDPKLGGTGCLPAYQGQRLAGYTGNCLEAAGAAKLAGQSSRAAQ